MKKERNNGRKASSEALMIPSADANLDSRGRREVGRRSFLKGLGMAGATLLPASALLTTKAEARLPGAIEAADLQEAMLPSSVSWPRPKSSKAISGNNTGNSEEPRTRIRNSLSKPTGGNPLYTDALTILDGDMAQYIQDNTDDEFSHAAFIRAYLASKGARRPRLIFSMALTFRTIPGSTAKGSTGKYG